MTEPPAMLRHLEELFLYRRDGLVVVNKPAEIPSTGLDLEDPRCLQFWLMRHFERMVWAVHQLDADTSGVNIFVLEKKLVAKVKARMEADSAGKIYFAICHGSPGFDHRDVREPIGFLDANQQHLGVTPAGRHAHTRITVLERSGSFAALRVRIFTGRTHQIRIHLAHIGHPLVGEYWYRKEPCRLAERQALHAASIRFEDGMQPDRFDAPLPDDLSELRDRLGFSGG